MTLPKSLTTVTPFSKAIALFLFIMLPFAGFYLGIMYQRIIDIQAFQLQQFSTIQSLQKIMPTPTVDTTNWKTYTNIKYDYSIQYPSDQVMQEIEPVHPDLQQSDCIEVGRANTDDPIFYAPQLYIEAITSEGSCYGNDIYSIYGAEVKKKMDTMKIDDVITPVENETITRKEDLSVDGNTAEVFDLTTSEWIERNIVINHNQQLYVIGGYNTDRKFDQMLQTFRFTN